MPSGSTTDHLAWSPDASSPDAWPAARVREVLDRPPPAAAVRTWWAALEPPQRETLLLRRPLLLGNLDGVPWPARVVANRRTAALLADALSSRRARGSWGAALADLLAEHRVPGVRSSRQLARQLTSLLEHDWFVPRPSGTGRYLIAFDPARESLVEWVGAAIAATDDPWASPFPASIDRIGVFVPGNDSAPGTFDGKAHAISEAVYRAGVGRSGMLVWQGGRFPFGIQVWSSRRVAPLARRLARFVNAIPRRAGDAVTAIGFSFGGSVLGTALAAGMRVDRVVHLSGAGLGPGIRRLAELPAAARVPHYAFLAPADLKIAPFAGVELQLGGIRLGHGGDPSRDPDIVRLETGWRRDRRDGPTDAHLTDALSAEHRPDGGGDSTDDDPVGRASGLLLGHETLLTTWGSTLKHQLAALLAAPPTPPGSEAGPDAPRVLLAAPRTGPWRLAERVGLPISPLLDPRYRPRSIPVR